MSSYADVAARGPTQTAEEARAAPVPELEQTESVESASLIDVDSQSVHTVPSDWQSQDVQTKTQRERLTIERELDEIKARSEEEYARAKKMGKKGARKIKANSENPIFVANALAVIGLSGALGFGAYRKYVGGELTWKVVGAWAGIVGLFGVGDFYLSQYVFRKYQAKQ